MNTERVFQALQKGYTVAAEEMVEAYRIAKYSPEQPREDNGRFAETGKKSYAVHYDMPGTAGTHATFNRRRDAMVAAKEFHYGATNGFLQPERVRTWVTEGENLNGKKLAEYTGGIPKPTNLDSPKESKVGHVIRSVARYAGKTALNMAAMAAIGVVAGAAIGRFKPSLGQKILDAQGKAEETGDLEKAFNADESRDERGRWTSGSAKADRASRKAVIRYAYLPGSKAQQLKSQAHQKAAEVNAKAAEAQLAAAEKHQSKGNDKKAAKASKKAANFQTRANWHSKRAKQVLKETRSETFANEREQRSGLRSSLSKRKMAIFLASSAVYAAAAAHFAYTLKGSGSFNRDWQQYANDQYEQQRRRNEQQQHAQEVRNRDYGTAASERDKTTVDRLYAMATQDTQSPHEAQIARNLLQQKFGVAYKKATKSPAASLTKAVASQKQPDLQALTDAAIQAAHEAIEKKNGLLEAASANLKAAEAYASATPEDAEEASLFAELASYHLGISGMLRRMSENQGD